MGSLQPINNSLSIKKEATKAVMIELEDKTLDKQLDV
jgi:hypothetical protein